MIADMNIVNLNNKYGETIMASYEIKIEIEVNEISEGSLRTNELIRGEDGSFRITLPDEAAISIDKSEQAFLKVGHAAIREGIANHVSQISKKKALKHQGNGGEVIKNNTLYQVDGEAGRFSFETYSVKKGEDVIYNTVGSVFAGQNGKERYKTSGYKEISIIYGAVENSYRDTASLINRIRHQEEATPVRTVADNTEREGKKLIDFIERKTNALLAANAFTKEGKPNEDRVEYKVGNVEVINEEQVERTIETYGISEEEKKEIRKNPVCYESSDNTVNISIDDVIVKHQKEERKEENKSGGKSKEREYVHNTVAHIQSGELSYTINGEGVLFTLRIIIAFLLNNKLLNKRLQFFVDGQKTLHMAIQAAFSWFSNMGIILDWYHLKDKCERELSLAMKGRQIRNEVLNHLMSLLWYGMVDKAKEYLNSLDSSLIKNKDALERLINYIERNRPYIPCYEVRKRLGLRNSSNRGEKSNDLIVSDRQKHNGMSWSNSGSVTLATLSALKRNQEYKKWFEEGDIEFKLAA